jgi:hypothetical protein
MGFHKRYVSESTIKTAYQESGFDGIAAIYRADAIISEDDFARKITDLFTEHFYHRDRQLLSTSVTKILKECY